MTVPRLSPDDLRSPPRAEDMVRFPDAFGARFLLAVDTEEEFDWNAPFDRDSRAVTIAKQMRDAQQFFTAAGVRPLYVTGYPVIDDAVAGPMLAEWQAAGEADIGAHCHPWVTPPHEEEVSARNSFAGNLPESLERAKIKALRDRIAAVTGRAPVVFRAGRYGVGPHTGAILADLGFRADTSIRSRFSYANEHGPDFSGLPVVPWRAGPARALIEMPLSTAWVGGVAAIGDRMQHLVDRRGPVAGALARSGLLQRVPLTPEGVSAKEAIRAVNRLIGDGVRLLLFSFHSPTLAPGHTPYVRNAADLAAFYRWWDVVLGHLARRGVAPAAIGDVISAAG